MTAFDVGLVATVFGVVFVAQLPGKSALAALVLATRRPPLQVAAGAFAALALHSAIAVGAGGLLAFLPQRPVRIGAGFLFLVSSVLMWRRKPETPPANAADETPRRSAGTLVLSFATVFLAEWGDLTQLGTAALAARYRRPLEVFVGAVLGLWVATGIAIAVGRGAGKLLRPDVTQKIAAAVFCAVGLALITGILS